MSAADDEKTAREVLLSNSRQVNWLKVLFLLQVNVSALVACHFLVYDSQWKTLFFTGLLVLLGVLGVTAGSHRLWAHQSYKATLELRVFLMFCQTLVGYGTIYDWVHSHRLHHKYFGTNLDPFNPNKGFLYAHVISLTQDLSPAQEKALEEIDMSDIEQDKVVMWQKKYYKLLFPIIVLLLPINAPAEYWGETIVASFFLAGWLRYALALHVAWLIHSATRIWGLQPGEKYPADTNLVFILTKSYWLSYHYLAPWDYKTSEFGKYGTDCVTKFIKVCEALEYASDLKTIDSATTRHALTKSVKENKPITQCLLELSDEAKNITANHYLVSKQYYEIPKSLSTHVM